MKSKISWRQKLENSPERRIVEGPKGRGYVLIPKALDLDVLVRCVESGRLVTDAQLRAKLARDFMADST